MNVIEKIQAWYRQHCDGDWEHSSGIEITTLDNPGWRVKIDLCDTLLEDEGFTPVRYGDCETYFGIREYSEERFGKWLNCYRDDEFFYGYGSADSLEEILQTFLRWAEESTDTSDHDDEAEELSALCCEGYFTPDNTANVERLYSRILNLPNESGQKREILRRYLDLWERARLWENE